MPHQCLKCGTLFPEGATTILRGCPDCRGTRFFYTKDPLPLSERERLLERTQRDLPSIVEELVANAKELAATPPPPTPVATPPRLEVPPAFAEPRGEATLLPGNRLLVKLPKALGQRVRRATEGWDYEAPAPRPGPIEVASPPLTSLSTSTDPSSTPYASPLSTPLSVPPEAVPPETLTIPDPGQYEIDVKRLLEKSPIIVQKDGTYLIHLPSLFEMPRKPPSR